MMMASAPHHARQNRLYSSDRLRCFYRDHSRDTDECIRPYQYDTTDLHRCYESILQDPRRRQLGSFFARVQARR